MRSTFLPRDTLRVCAAALIGLTNSVAYAQTISISLSDNLIVLSERQRFGVIEMANLGADPVEFSVTTSPGEQGKLADGTAVLRWAPARTVAPAHRGAPFRVSMRTSASMPPGEYAFRGIVTSKVLRAEAQRAVPPVEGEAVVDGIGGSVAVSPALPITVYVRHLIDDPMIDVQGWEPAAAGNELVGNFLVKKRFPERSFVGHVEVKDKISGAVLISGRLHLRPGTDPAQVRVPWPKERQGLSGSYCLRVWSRFPADGPPAQEFCGT